LVPHYAKNLTLPRRSRISFVDFIIAWFADLSSGDCKCTLHIRSRGEEAKELKKKAGKRARRWIVERTHSWMNRFRRILIRWEKKPENYIAFWHFACALIAFRAAGLFG
jgi:transposase